MEIHDTTGMLARKLDDYDRMATRNAELEDHNALLEEQLEREGRRVRSVTAGFAGMRERLDMAFGAPNGEDRYAKGRPAGLEGAIAWAIAEHARVCRELKELTDATMEVRAAALEDCRARGEG